MKIKRIITGLLGFPLVACVLIFIDNKYVIDIAFAIIAAMSIHEYFNGFKGKEKPIIWVGYLASSLIAFIHVFELIPQPYLSYIIALIIPIFLLILFLHIVFTNMKITINDIMVTFFGICYIVFFTMFIPLLRGAENGKILVWYLIFAAWGTDIFAYLVGVKFGKHKFTKISPNKSLEGCIGGTIGAIILMMIYTYICNTFWGMEINYIYIGMVSLFLSLLGQIGDLLASSIKRYLGIKDFSNLIPGHGGMLDRIDSVIFIAPFAYVLLMII